MRQSQLLRKVSGRRLQDAATTGPEPALPPRPAPRPASCHHDSTPTPGQHPNTRTPVVRYTDTCPCLQHPVSTPTPNWDPDTLLAPRQPAAGHRGTRPASDSPLASPHPEPPPPRPVLPRGLVLAHLVASATFLTNREVLGGLV